MNEPCSCEDWSKELATCERRDSCGPAIDVSSVVGRDTDFAA
jgi:hypothetical protein